MNFYGFNWQDVPAYSKLFSPSVVNRAQSAYGQGMSQFTPYDPQQLEKLKAAQAQQQTQQPAQQSSGKFLVGPDGRVYDSTKSNWFSGYVQNNPTLSDFRGNELGARNANQDAKYQTRKPGPEFTAELMKRYGFKNI